MRRLEVFLLHPGWDASPSQGYPAILNLPVFIDTPERKEALASPGWDASPSQGYLPRPVFKFAGNHYSWVERGTARVLTMSLARD